MPKIVDWDARRDEILAATWRVIARDGIARATIRAIAREADCSRGILAHYFNDKANIPRLGAAALPPPRGDPDGSPAAGLTGLAALRVIMLEGAAAGLRALISRPRSRSASGAGRWATRRCASCSTPEFDRFTERLRGHLVEAEKDAELRRAWTSRWPRTSYSC